jgi:hypothetical protein
MVASRRQNRVRQLKDTWPVEPRVYRFSLGRKEGQKRRQDLTPKMSLLEDSFYGPAIIEWVRTEGGCEECRRKIITRAGEIKFRSSLPTKTFDTWYSGGKEFLLPTSATVQEYLGCLRSSNFDGFESGWVECVRYLIAAAGLIQQATENAMRFMANTLSANILESAIIEVVLARVAPNVPDHNFDIHVPLNATETEAIYWRGILYQAATRSNMNDILQAKVGHANCPKWL